jgi:quercetin dioxygenase-like cupin family protein
MTTRSPGSASGPLNRPNGEIDAMIDAEVNEGGPPSPVPCDTAFDTSARKETHQSMSENTLPIEISPAPDRILHLPLGTTVGGVKSAMLMKSDGLELIRLVIPAGKEIPPHRAPGEITVQCIEGLIAFEHDGHALELRPGDLLHLGPQETHSLKGVADSSVLVTRLRLHADELPEKLPSR